jgi:hypothetical protein
LACVDHGVNRQTDGFIDESDVGTGTAPSTANRTSHAEECDASIYDGCHEWKKAELMRAEAAQIAQSTAVSAAKSADAGSKR